MMFRCLAGRMAMPACQIDPTDTAPPCPGSPHRACVGKRGECNDVTETQKISTLNFWKLDPFRYVRQKLWKHVEENEEKLLTNFVKMLRQL